MCDQKQWPFRSPTPSTTAIASRGASSTGLMDSVPTHTRDRQHALLEAQLSQSMPQLKPLVVVRARDEMERTRRMADIKAKRQMQKSIDTLRNTKLVIDEPLRPVVLD